MTLTPRFRGFEGLVNRRVTLQTQQPYQPNQHTAIRAYMQFNAISVQYVLWYRLKT
jgi:hypothetical protein